MSKMLNPQALSLLQKILRDSRNLSLHFFQDWDSDISLMDDGLREQFENSENHYEPLREILRKLSSTAIVNLKDHLKMSYVLFRGDGEQDFFSIGPFRSLPLEDDDLICIRQENKLSTSSGEALGILLKKVPCNIMRIEALSVARNIMLSFYDISQPEVFEMRITPQDVPEILLRESLDHRARLIEEVYVHENMLCVAIAQGDYKNALREAKFFMHSNMNYRTMDSRISHRSLLYAANTLFRKAAGEIGIHPLYLDKISREFAQRLSLAATHSQLNSIYFEMIEEYCRMCAEYPGKQYSRNVQLIMNYVRFNLSDDLSPGKIAQAVSFSPSYISRIFKDEVGKPLMVYVSEQRIQTARQLLAKTQMPIHEVAGYVGIPDWNYFTKLFKKMEGCTPSAFRANQRFCGE